MLGEEIGAVKVSKKAIAQIVLETIKGIEGAYGLSGNFFGKMKKFFGLSHSRGIKIDLLTEREVAIGISLIIEYGREISVVSNEVQEKVKGAVEEMTGLEVLGVSVKIEGVGGGK